MHVLAQHPALASAFYAGVMKVSGPGWDLHGYSRDHAPAEMVAAAQARAAAEQKAVGKYPSLRNRGWLARTFQPRGGRKHRRRVAEHGQRYDQFRKENPGDPEWDLMDYRDDSRIETPHDRQTSYKLNDRLAGEHLRDQTSDDVYSKETTDHRLSKEELQKVLGTYQGTMTDDAWEHIPEGKPYADAFVAKAKALMADPNFQYARLEWE